MHLNAFESSLPLSVSGQGNRQRQVSLGHSLAGDDLYHGPHLRRRSAVGDDKSWHPGNPGDSAGVTPGDGDYRFPALLKGRDESLLPLIRPIDVPFDQFPLAKDDHVVRRRSSQGLGIDCVSAIALIQVKDQLCDLKALLAQRLGQQGAVAGSGRGKLVGAQE